MRVKVGLEIEVTGDATFEEVEEYLQFEFHCSGRCGSDNPFFDEDGDSDYSVERFSIEEL